MFYFLKAKIKILLFFCVKFIFFSQTIAISRIYDILKPYGDENKGEKHKKHERTEQNLFQRYRQIRFRADLFLRESIHSRFLYGHAQSQLF